MRLVIVGSGKIACGYLAPLFAAAGWQVTLACRAAQTADRIRRAAGWGVEVTGASPFARTVTGVAAVRAGSFAFRRAVADADLLVTAVGVGNVATLGEPLADALAGRRRPIDIWVVENGDCAAGLRSAILAASSGRPLPAFGIAGAVATVAVGRGGWGPGERPVFVGDADRVLTVDRNGLLGQVPTLDGVRATASYLARLHEKLYVFNAGHAITAYLGWLGGHDSMDRAIGDPLVRPIVVGCLLEARRAVLAAYPCLVGGSEFNAAADIHGPVAAALVRYADRQLADPVNRVAREPIRKLAPGDRLLGPVRLIRSVGGSVPAHFALGVAAALLYGRGRDDAAGRDAQARVLRGQLASRGVMAVLDEFCCLSEDDPFTHAVAERYRGFVFADDAVLFPPVHTTDALLAPRMDGPSTGRFSPSAPHALASGALRKGQ